MTDVNPDQIMKDIEEARSRLVALGEGYAIDRRNLAEKLLAYEKAIGKQYLTMLDESKKTKERLPAEDVRKVLAHDRIDEKIYNEYLLAEADVDIADRLFKIETANLSGLQSELQQLRVELTHA